MSTRASAISAAGVVLSQPTRQTRPSKSCACTISSIESAITSREISEARIPGVPCDWLSETAIVLKPSGDAARGGHALADAVGELAQVQVARHRSRPRRGDADDRPAEPRRVDPHRAEMRPRRGALRGIRQPGPRAIAERFLVVFHDATDVVWPSFAARDG